MMTVAALISRSLPVWLGGGDDIIDDAGTYFMIFAFSIPLMQMNNLSAAMLKCEGKMRISSALSVTLCALDMLFNFLFIFPSRHITLLGTEWYIPGLGLGVTGAALGTTLAFAIVMLIQCWFAFYHSEVLGVIRLKTKMVFKASYIRNALKISIPIACQSVLVSGAQIVSTMIVAPLGNFAIAAHTFAITAESLCYMPGYGIGEAATTLVGQSVGAVRRDLCRSFANMAVITGMIVMTLMGIIMYIAAPNLMAVMTPVEAIRSLGTDCLRIEAFAEPMFAASIVAYQVFVGTGDTLKPAVINLFSMWAIRLTLAALLATAYGLQGVWFAMAVELTVRGILFLIRLHRGRWLKII
jgi:putative MATE family efflux protein